MESESIMIVILLMLRYVCSKIKNFQELVHVICISFSTIERLNQVTNHVRKMRMNVWVNEAIFIISESHFSPKKSWVPSTYQGMTSCIGMWTRNHLGFLLVVLLVCDTWKSLDLWSHSSIPLLYLHFQQNLLLLLAVLTLPS